MCQNQEKSTVIHFFVSLHSPYPDTSVKQFILTKSFGRFLKPGQPYLVGLGEFGRVFEL